MSAEASLADLKDVAYPDGKARRDELNKPEQNSGSNLAGGQPQNDAPRVEADGFTPGVSEIAGNDPKTVVTDPKTGGDCKSAIRDYFKNADPKAIQKFLRLQADLTTQRLGWAFLKGIGDGSKLKRAEDTILDLLKQKYGPDVLDKAEFVGPGKLFKDSSELAAFKKARDEFEKAPLSRRALANIGPYLSAILKNQLGADPKNTPFLISDADVKLLDVLATANGDKNDKQAEGRVLNLMKLVDSTIRGKDLGKESVDKALNDLQKKIERLNRDFEREAGSLAKSIPQCQSEDARKALACPSGKVPSVDRLFLDCQDAIGAMYEGIKLRSDQAEALKYGSVWSKVRLKNIEQPQPDPDPKKSPAKEAPLDTAQVKTQLSSWFATPSLVGPGSKNLGKCKVEITEVSSSSGTSFGLNGLTQPTLKYEIQSSNSSYRFIDEDGSKLRNPSDQLIQNLAKRCGFYKQ